MSILEFVRLLLLPVCAFFLTGLLAGTLAERLAVARLLHDEILEGIGEGILVLDRDRNALYHNKEFQRLLRSTGPTYGKSLQVLLGGAIDEQAAEVLGDHASRRTDTIFKRQD